MLAWGHWTSFLTSSHINDASECTHRPGQSSTLAVLVTDPSKPVKNDEKPADGLGLSRGGGISSLGRAGVAAAPPSLAASCC